MSNKPTAQGELFGPTKNSDPATTTSIITAASADSSYVSISLEEPKTPTPDKSDNTTSPSEDPLPASSPLFKGLVIRCRDCGLMLLSDSYAEQRLHWATKHGPSRMSVMEEVEVDGMVVVDTKEEQEEGIKQAEDESQIWVLVVGESIAGGYVTIDESC